MEWIGTWLLADANKNVLPPNSRPTSTIPRRARAANRNKYSPSHGSNRINSLGSSDFTGNDTDTAFRERDLALKRRNAPMNRGSLQDGATSRCLVRKDRPKRR